MIDDDDLFFVLFLAPLLVTLGLIVAACFDRVAKSQAFLRSLWVITSLFTACWIGSGWIEEAELMLVPLVALIAYSTLQRSTPRLFIPPHEALPFAPHPYRDQTSVR